MTRVAALIRCGQLCDKCTQKKCEHKNETIELECPACDGMGCDECRDGYFRIDGCPQKFVRPLLPAIEMSDLWERRHALPVSGGLLDQAASFLDFYQLLTSEDRKAKDFGKHGR